MKKLYSFSIIAIISLFYLTSPITLDISQEKTLYDGFISSGAKIMESLVYGYGRLEDEFLSLEDLAKISVEKFVLFGFDKEKITEIDPNNFENHTQSQINYPIMRKIQLDGYNEVTLEGQNAKDQWIKIKSQSNYITENNKVKGNSYISVEVISKTEHHLIQELTSFVEGIIDRPMKNGISSYISGYFEGNIGLEQQKSVINNIMASMKTTNIKTMSNELYASATGYSPYIHQWVNMGQGKVNIQISTRYSAYEDKTFIWMATPLITIEY